MRTTTDASGSFLFDSINEGSYSIQAEQLGTHSTLVHGVISSKTTVSLELVLAPPQNTVPKPLQEFSLSEKEVNFADKPDFMVSGVTDWTAVGGHGSDATLRASESLARETLKLGALPKSQGSSNGLQTESKDHLTEAELKASVAAAPQNYRANHDLGEYYLHLARFGEALPFLQAAFDLNGRQPEDEYELAVACRGVGDLGKARQHVISAIKLKDSADFELLAGELDEKLGDPLAAVREFRHSTELSASEESYIAWGSELLLHRAVWQAIEVFQSGVKVLPSSARLKTALGAALFSGALYDRAAQQLCEASDLAPASIETYRIMGKIEVASPTPLPCIEQRLARFAKTNNENAESSFLYAISLLKANPELHRHKAEELLTTAVKLDPHLSDAFLQLGILAFAERKYPEAIELFTKAVEADPKQGEAHYRLAAAYSRIGKSDQAKQELHLHDEIEKAQADEVEKERRQIKQFLVMTQSQPSLQSHP